ncbi:TIGR03790 family protein [Duganella aquatilis]|uniref:TIGR03790 family protein n=1 Tax=Duganella aquatilis TaxID=2666082 RepID=UPI0035308A43
MRFRILFSLAFLACCAAQAQQVRPAEGSPLTAAQLAVVINDDDPLSVEVGEYYRKVRDVPPQNVVHVRIPNSPRQLNAEQFRHLKEQIDARLTPQIQAVLMVWTAPYAVECNSITSAYTLGLDSALCQKPCEPSKPSNYFNAPAGLPFQGYGMRLSMLLPTESLAAAKALIGRGMASGFSMPNASAYYLTTSETPRNSRAPFFPRPGALPARKLTIKQLHADSLEGQSDIMIYQTGMARVAKLDTLRFLPGALADHLTSTGGDLLSDGQMSSLRWLDAGATASYGSVTEPCNYWQKFPQPTVLLRQYLQGNTAIEAYWKSVAWPAQGVFIGEPLAAPYRR